MVVSSHIWSPGDFIEFLDQVSDFLRDVIHAKLALGGHLTKSQESMRHARNYLHPDIDPSIVKFAGELNIFVKTRIEVRGNDDSLGKLFQNLLITEKWRQEHVADGLSHVQFILDCSRTRTEIVWILICIETSKEDSKHQKRINQGQKS